MLKSPANCKTSLNTRERIADVIALARRANAMHAAGELGWRRRVRHARGAGGVDPQAPDSAPPQDPAYTRSHLGATPRKIHDNFPKAIE